MTLVKYHIFGDILCFLGSALYFGADSRKHRVSEEASEHFLKSNLDISLS